MALVDSVSAKRPLDGLDAPEIHQPKRFKISELPLTHSQRSAIDGLVHTIKKRGIYDSLRHQILAEYKESPEKAAFTDSLHQFAESEIDRDSKWLSLNRSKAASLLQGVMDRSDVYKSAESSFETLIAQHIGQIETAAREIRRVDVGDEVAAEEEIKGRKTDDEYAKEAAKRQTGLARVRELEEKKQKREEQKEALRLEEAQKMKELEKLRQVEERRKEREARKAAAIKGQTERKAMYEQFREEKEREREQQREQQTTMASGSLPETPAARLPTDEELEDLALNQLIKEGAEMAAKNNKKQPDPVVESAPPTKIANIAIPKGPAADRFKAGFKPEHPGPKLSYSSTHRGATQLPPTLSSTSRERSRSPYRNTNGTGERTPSLSHYEHNTDAFPHNYHHRGSATWTENELKPNYSSRRDSYDEGHGHSGHRRDSTRDSVKGAHQRDHDHEQDHERDYYHKQDRAPKEYSERKARHTEARVPKVDLDPHTGKARASLEDPPENIDRYIPSKGSVGRTRERDRDHDRDRDRDRHRSSYDDRDRDRERDRDRDYGEKDRYRDRARDSDRQRSYPEKDRYRDKDEYRSAPRDRGEREKDYSRPFKPRRDVAPKDIDRYVPGQ